MRRADAGLAAAVVLVVAGALVTTGARTPAPVVAAPTASAPPAKSVARDPFDALVLDPDAVERPTQAVHPAGETVGSAACAKCHADVAARFAERPMARTGLHRIAGRTAALDALFDGRRTVLHAASGFAYRPAHDADGYFVEERLDAPDGRPLHLRRERVTVTFTAGALGTAFGFERGGRIYQVPTDWYPQAATWALDPGFVQNGRFSRPFAPACLGCHLEAPATAAGGEAPGHGGSLVGGIGCERCHGPGGRHVKTTLAADVVNPARLPFARQLELCAQCHLEGTAETMRAGARLAGYVAGAPLDAHEVQWVERAAPVDAFTLTSASDRLVRSACFLRAPGKLGCTTCHDVHGEEHAAAATRVRAVCVGCHEPKSGGRSCTGPAAARAERRDDCATCHMARDTPSDFRAEVPGVRLDVTDHWIRVRPQPPRSLDAPPSAHAVSAIVPWARLVGDETSGGDDLPALGALAHLQSGLPVEGLARLAALPPKPPPLPAFHRLVGDVYAGRAEAAPPDSAERRHALERERAARAIEAKLSPDDPDARVRLARASIALGTADGARDAEAALRDALALAADDADALLELGGLLFRAGRLDGALPLLERAAAVGTDAVEAHVILAVLARAHGDPRLAATRFEQARREAPRDRWILEQLRGLYATLGDASGAEEIAHALAHAPPALPPDVDRATRWLPAALR